MNMGEETVEYADGDWLIRPRGRFQGLLRRDVIAKAYRYFGREWARLGQPERSAWCHHQADWFELPWWKQVWFSEWPSSRPPLEK